MLSETQYVERHGPELIAQAFGMDGVHTYNRGEHWEAVDARACALKEQGL